MELLRLEAAIRTRHVQNCIIRPCEENIELVNLIMVHSWTQFAATMFSRQDTVQGSYTSSIIPRLLHL